MELILNFNLHISNICSSTARQLKRPNQIKYIFELHSKNNFDYYPYSLTSNTFP